MKALITAGNKKLGSEISYFLEKKGYDVIVSYHTEKPNSFESIQADFSTKEGVLAFCDTVLEKYGDIDLLVNNFGPLLLKPILGTSPEEFQNQFQHGVFTPFTLIQKFLPGLIRTKGQVVNIGLCGLNHEKVNSHFPIYKMMKKNLLFLTKSFAKELAPKGVRLNMISPGYLEDTEDFPSDIEKLPHKKLISYEEVLSSLSFVIDPKNRSITGQNLEVSGAVGL